MRDVRPGAFVWLSGPLSRRGIGKVVARAPGSVSVEFFYSVARRATETVHESQVNVIERVASQTRCYIRQDDSRWLMGRIGRRVGGEYEVLFRQGRACFLPESQIHVRCLAPIDDPIETLVYKGHETPFFHDRRFRFVRSLVAQRAACRGMTGLVSSRIRLFPHQVEVVRRVLEDPVQRYLLADEVGLGKTIEAGVILRQYLIDSREGRALVLVPALLIDQWAEELELKFHLSRFGEGRVLVRAVEDVGHARKEGSFGLVVIDEAQHVAAFASAGAAGQDRYRDYESLCNEAERVLLLSATPVLNNERDFLAMLHLLDPSVYDLHDVEAFRARVRNRQEVGHVLLSLQVGSPAYVIGPSVERIRTLFPGDTVLARLLNDLEGAVAGDAVDEPARDCAIRAVRIHVSETYRLHRRMLRSRRAGIEGAELLGRAGGEGDRTPRILEYDLDDRSPRVHSLLDDWRDAASASVVEDAGGESGDRERAVVRIFSVLLQCAGTWLELLRVAVRCRLGHPDGGGAILGDVPAGDVRLLADTPLFAGERDILEAILAVLAEVPEDGDRIDLLAESLANVRRSGRGAQPTPKCVVFSAHTSVCHQILLRLRSDFGDQAVAAYHRGLSRQQIEEGIARFRTHPACFVLVCDGSGEEGRNLQFADRVMHVDLPLAPNRVEQRIGRLDRIGRDRPVRSTIFIGPDCDGSLFAAWYAVLNEGFRVFDRSIASLQFYVEESLQTLLRRALCDGAEGLRAEAQTIRAGCEAEQERIDEQDALDAIDAFDQDAASCFGAIAALESAHQSLEADLHGWVGEALMFRRDPDFYRQERTTHYGPEFDRYGELRTLVPSDWLQHRLSRHLERPGAFDRAVALRVAGTPVLRIGEGFIDAMARYLRWDDRGQAFALWRHEAGWDPAEGAEWIGFRFNYVVSADLREARRVLAEHRLPADALQSLQRRADALFPPLTEVVFLDTDRCPAEGQSLLAILDRAYLAHDRGGRDYNLANERLGVLDQLVPPSMWAALCTSARAASADEVLGRGDPPLRERCEEFARRAEVVTAGRLTQLRLRAELGAGDVTRDLAAEEAVGAALVRGIRCPELRLDSVGFLVVSGRPPGAVAEDAP